MAKPFEHADDERPTAKERFRQRVAESRSAKDRTDDDFDDDDDDDDEQEEEEEDDDREPSEGARETELDPVISVRKEKKRERGARFREDVSTLRSELQELKEKNARLEGAVMQRQQIVDRTDERPKTDVFETELNRLDTELRSHYDSLMRIPQASRTQKDIDSYNSKNREIEDKKAEVRFDRVAHKRGIRPGVDPVQAARQAALQQQYSDVYANQKAVDYAEGTYRTLLAKGHKDGPETLELSMTAARREFRLGRPADPRTPTRERKAKFEGVRQGSTSKGDGARSDGAGLELRMTKDLRRMANARFAHIKDDQKRYEAFARSKPGRNLARRLRDGE